MKTATGIGQQAVIGWSKKLSRSQLPMYRHLASVYWGRRALSPERFFRKLEKRVLPVDRSVFTDPIDFYRERYGESFSWDDASRRAEDKASHKDAWFQRERDSIEDITAFYSEVHVYPFRQPVNWRYGSTTWLLSMVRHLPKSAILEYGCGSACLTEKLMRADQDDHDFVVADIPSVTLEFVRWKKERHAYPYEILEIAPGRDGIPIWGREFGLVVCKDVLEHTPNPAEIVEAFCDALVPGGILVLDFMNAPGGENLERSVAQRKKAIATLSSRLMPIKGIDWLGKNNGVYWKPGA